MRNKSFAQGIAVLAALMLVLAATPAAGWDKERFEEKFEKTESLDRDGKVSISNISGRIDVKSWDQAQVKIEALKISQAGSLDKAKENAALVKIEVAKTGNILQISTKYPDSGLFKNSSINVSVDYTVWVPDKASVKVRSVSGDVAAGKIGGAFEGSITSGDILLSGIGQGVDCHTVSGTIGVLDVAGDVNLKTVSGTIKAERIKGSCEVETTSGKIILRDVSEARSVRAKVLSGNVEYSGQIAPGGKYSFEALSGNIDLLIPASAAFELEAESFSGSIRTDFPVTVQGKVSARELRGVVGNGGATLRVKSFSGNVEIRKK
jgi:DUF4097 and DUF4098 domain-containing protein YvlB